MSKVKMPELPSAEMIDTGECFWTLSQMRAVQLAAAEAMREACAAELDRLVAKCETDALRRSSEFTKALCLSDAEAYRDAATAIRALEVEQS